MKKAFTDSGTWILPKEGTQGNKAKNLLENTPVIESCGAFVPRSLVVPYEYLRATKGPAGPALLTLSIADNYFPNWMRINVRSNAPDEDLNFRFPGQYTSEDIWHKDRDFATVLISRVIESYDQEAVAHRRQRLGLKEQGMCLLVQEHISNTPGNYDATYAGCFSDIGEFALLTFNDPKNGLQAMTEPAIRRSWVDAKGNIEGEHSKEDAGLAQKLRKLSDSLPKIEGKGWEIEFVENKKGTYVVQVTPIMKRNRVVIPENAESIFECSEAVGFDSVITEGILYAPENAGLTSHIKQLMEFDKTHPNYCLITMHNSPLIKLKHLSFLTNSSAILDVAGLYDMRYPFAAHVAQQMREGRVALSGHFPRSEQSKKICDIIERDVYKNASSMDCKVWYSPTRLAIIADEKFKKGIVSLVDGNIADFSPIECQIR